MSVKITEDMTIAETLKAKPSVEAVFTGYGMHCLYCPMSSGESISAAARSHGIDLAELLGKLNDAE